MANRVNSASITGTGTTASAMTTTFGVSVAAGDLIVVTATCNGTHVTNGMACSDTVNGTYTTLLETQGGGSSTRWMQTFWKVAAITASTVTISCTPYASNTAGRFVVDVYRGTAGTISRAAVGNSGASGTTATGPALASAPVAGDLVCALAITVSGTLTPPSPFVTGSNSTTNATAYNSHVLLASGASTYGGTWSLGTTNISAEQVVAFTQAVVIPRPIPKFRSQATIRGSVV